MEFLENDEKFGMIQKRKLENFGNLKKWKIFNCFFKITTIRGKL